ncbi:MAG: O-methyltransferase [Anaerolineae bacterium]|nr:O-methyltransferase [Anaerolineae bacterium]
MVKRIDNPLDQYIADLFAPEDEALQWIQAESDRQGIPPISILPDEGKLIYFLARAIGARRAVEIGVLAGYSGVWIARALPADGKLYALELSERHARLAQRSFEKAGVAERVEIVEGPALDSLNRISPHGPFDFVFIDADKPTYVEYLNWAVANLRPGGMVAAHNALSGRRILAPESEQDVAMAAFNRALAEDPRLDSTIIAVGDGLAAGIKKG